MPMFVAKNAAAGHEVSLEQDGHDVDVRIDDVRILWFDHETGTVFLQELADDELPDIPRGSTGKHIRVSNV